ncbi:hypothetical protein TARUN_8834 [Trichoderma arundinaceum]|uniref:Uncharacterized protein n=1 Tax=Trichoderma arundinaceum TaxID=490622 RepID=A0A395NBF8_TRIAR|nr:hypothetical protein TARUN_8834 [Trichoderma arundinaceum]
MAPRILFILTSRAKMDNGAPTGWYLPEFARPYYHFISPDEAKPRAEIAVASPAGGLAPIDEVSVKNFKDPARRATSFSNVEEDAINLSKAMPALLEDEIKREQVVIDRRVITGQNPNSAQGVGVAIAQALSLESA